MKAANVLRAAVAAALFGAPAMLLAQPAGVTSAMLASLSGNDAPRVTQTIDNRVVSPLQHTHLAFVGQLTPSSRVADSMPMNHMQLVLRPSAQRIAALKSLIAQQHDPKSAWFHKWLNPEQYGATFGVADSDIAAAKSWLVSQGFTVNGVYPNKTQIDFSGTAGQVARAFHTQENVYSIGGAKHIANAGDISVPTALQSVVVGVMGLNDMHATSMHVKPKIANYNASTGLFDEKPVNGKAQAINFQGGARGLVPNDLAKIYNVLPLRRNGVTGQGVTIAVVEDSDMVPADWTNFVSQFGLAQYGGTFNQMQPQPPSGSTTNNCTDPNDATASGESGETLLDAEWSTAMAPGANIVVATCADSGSSNFFGGVYTASINLINASEGRPDIISASYGYGEGYTDAASKTAIDAMWAQADAEGISVFVSSGDSGSNPSFNGGLINGVGVDANSFATSPNVTAVGGTDFADVLDKTTSQYFSSTPLNAVYGTALSYVPEIPWNESCGNGVAAKSRGWPSVVAFCQAQLAVQWAGGYNQNTPAWTSEGGSGGPSSVDRKPAWQRMITGAAKDQSRDLPDVSLFAGSYGGYTWVVTCTANNPCTPNWSGSISLSGGTSLASPMFAGIQALIDQGLAARGLPLDQGNAAPTLYALASSEYGTGSGPAPASLAACSANNGTNGTANCVFHNVTRGSNSTNCLVLPKQDGGIGSTPDCYVYAWEPDGNGKSYGFGLTSLDPTSYSRTTKAYPAQPGWSFAAGLGSVDATNLMIAWRAFVAAPPAGTLQ